RRPHAAARSGPRTEGPDESRGRASGRDHPRSRAAPVHDGVTEPDHVDRRQRCKNDGTRDRAGPLEPRLAPSKSEEGRLALLQDAPWNPPPELGAQGSNVGIVALRQLREERLVLARDEHDARSAEADRTTIALEEAEEPVMMPLRPIHPHLEEA